MKAYRYLRPEYGDDFLVGRMKIGTTDYYKTMESHAKDPMEATYIRQIENLIISDTRLQSNELLALAECGIDVDPGLGEVDFRFSDMSGQHSLRSMFAMCMSKSKENRKFLNEGQNFVVEITDIDRFAAVIMLLNLKLFAHVMCGEIKYKGLSPCLLRHNGW